jgi:flavin reductase (DIM6/NTAB) family NADH-FMN oxidoreductase RutF
MGYRHEADKFGAARLTPVPSLDVRPPRVAECPVQLEALLEARHDLARGDESRRGHLLGLEVRVTRVHVHPSLLLEGHSDRIDPVKWRPLIMSFCHFFGLGERIHPSRLAEIPESAYRPRALAAAS